MRRFLLVVCLIGVVVTLVGLTTACSGDDGKDGAVVHAIFFYSPSCPHCHQVREQDLPPLEKKYGRRLEILEVDAATPEGRELFYATLAHFQIDRAGVPMLVIDDIVLTGSVEIPQYLPTMIEYGLEEGGVDWPPIPGFEPPEG
jgi:thiol-disulfide isomerase/thioredoxin